MVSTLAVCIAPLLPHCRFVIFANMAEGVIVIGATNFPEMLDKFVHVLLSHTLPLIYYLFQGTRPTWSLRQTSSRALA